MNGRQTLFRFLGGLTLMIAAGSACSAKSPNQPAQAFKFRNVKLSLPQDFDVEFPAGPDLSAINTNCRACHSPSMILSQPKLRHGEWEKVVAKMVTIYRAPVPEDEVPKVLNYLDSLPDRGKKKP